MQNIIKIFIASTLFLFCVLSHATTLDFEIKGISKEVLDNVQKRLLILTTSYGKLTAGKVQAIYRQASTDISVAMQPYGYFHARIVSHLSKQKDNWIAHFNIQPNKAIRISQLTIKVVGPGNDNIKINRSINSFPVKEGDVFRADIYEKAKESLFQTASNEGYIDALFINSKILIDVVHDDVKIILILQTGPKFYFGKVIFENTTYSNEFLERFITFDKNTPFSSEKLLSFQQQLSEASYFQQVIITPHFDKKQDKHIPITMNLPAPKSRQYNLGIGYATFTGPRLVSNINLYRLTDTGQHLDTQLRLSHIISGLAAKYYIPGSRPLSDKWLVGINYQRFLPKNATSTSTGLTAGYVTKTKNTQISMDMNYLVEHYKIDSLNAESTQLFYPNLNFTYTHSNDLINPSKGKSIDVTLRGATRTILSSTSFLQAELKAKYFFTPLDFAHILLRTNLGYTVTKDLIKLPLSMRFFAGGMNSIRGYADSAIGPGRYLYTGSIEYQNHIKNNWWGAVFYDVGTATNQIGTKLFKGKGIGVIYTSFIGPIKFYVAEGEKKSKKTYLMEFSVGPEF